jgi:biopolymer transport protein TolQ
MSFARTFPFLVPIALAIPSAARAATPGTFDSILMAGPVVKGVLAILILFSVLSWAIIFMKGWLFRKVGRNQRDFLRSFEEGKGLGSLFELAKRQPSTPLTEVFRAGYLEYLKFHREKPESGRPSSDESVCVENVHRSMRKAANQELERLETYLPFLATTGSATPFVGLFGTVWGIMNAFTGIAATGNASLATVSPGIAEALVTTAAGLAVAIPAVMAYNYYLNRVRSEALVIDNFTFDVLNLVQRSADRM